MVPAEKILAVAREKNVDMIGLSGLITPSLDEMVHVANEMQNQGFEQPLLIGGATTSAIHTAVKIAPAYHQGVVHVLDASRAVGVVGRLMNRDTREAFIREAQRAQDAARTKYLERQQQIPLVTIEEARKRRFPIDWTSAGRPPKPSFGGIRLVVDLQLGELLPFIDWSPLFHAWQLRGTYPKIFEDKVIGNKARELFDDAQTLLEMIVRERKLRPHGVHGFWPANSVGDDIEIYADESRTQVLAVVHTLRQQVRKAEGQFNLALADFIAPKTTGIPDYLGAFAVAAGEGLDQLCAKFEADHDDYSSIMAKALADRLAEAFAEYLHKQVRDAWGYGAGENLSSEDLIKERYRGIRPAPGYPAIPDHTEKRTLFDLLDAESNAGIELTESFAMVPASSVCGLYFSHPSAEYFSVGKIDRDQVLDYSKRKGRDVKDVERWLGPNLAFDASR
jgi:5-methyltetrahydrofolate--homocysteine methyltransferase